MVPIWLGTDMSLDRFGTGHFVPKTTFLAPNCTGTELSRVGTNNDGADTYGAFVDINVGAFPLGAEVDNNGAL
jgi:hypothetical protein